MENTPNHILEKIFVAQKRYFQSQQTKDIDFRLQTKVQILI